MTPYTPNSRKSTARAEFAAAAVREVFHPRDLRLASEPGFVDRRPGRAAQRLDHVAAEVTEDLGQSALRHWVSQAARAESPEERETALEIAAEIARLAGIPFEELFEQEAA